MEKPNKFCRAFLLTKSNGLISATRSFREPFFTHNCRRKGIRISGQNVQKRDFLTDAWPIEEGIDGSCRALARTIPFSAWALQRNTEARVSLVYRNDDGVNASTGSTVVRVDEADSIARQPDRLAKSGAIRLPHFSRISSQITWHGAVNTEYPATASWPSESAVPDSTDGASLAWHVGFRMLRPRGCAVSVPRHYSASHCSDAAIYHLSSLEPSIKMNHPGFPGGSIHVSEWFRESRC